MPKNIVLLSDGTGNAASSPFKTNVWRLYQALDIGPLDPTRPGDRVQIVLYDNGVGTETFKPLAMLGLALGLGVATNVKNLYTFLCRNYKPGDKIYLFGFSRGAFTIRVLAGLILRCGVITDAPSDDELRERVEHAYTKYKRDAAQRATKAGRALIFGHILGDHVDDSDFKFERAKPDIDFLGVWDTVDAYGMPIDELKVGIDRWIWPMTLADRTLSPKILKARHALSLDDERPTFRPVLWTDPTPEKNPGQLKQVWFSGVHANVGGGYPDDGLSCVALQWIVEEAAATGLRYYPDLLKDYADQADAQGLQYDSRAGLAGYYRYGPRNVDDLCLDKVHDVTIAKPTIHGSVLERIRGRQVAYAPISFPKSASGYDVVGGTPETKAEIQARAAAREIVDDAVFRRLIAYFFTVAFTIALVALPVADLIYDWLMKAISTQHGTVALLIYRVLAAPLSAFAWLGELLSQIPLWSSATQCLGSGLKWLVTEQIAPVWTQFWINSFAGHPALFVLCGVTVLWLFIKKSQLLQEQVLARAELMWRSPAEAGAPKWAPGWIDRILRAIRANEIVINIYLYLARHIIPALFAFLVALPIGCVALLFLWPKFWRERRRGQRYGTT
jgi:uncharacterized protein (DUF2235 family)